MSHEDILSTDTGRRLRKRVGRGTGSRTGKTCGRGSKGEGSRTGRTHNPLFEGGQTKFWMRIPRRGFSNANFTIRYAIVPLDRVLKRIDAAVIDQAAMVAAGLVDQAELIKITSGSAITRAVTLRVHKVTASVRAAVEAAGGKVEELDG